MRLLLEYRIHFMHSLNTPVGSYAIYSWKKTSPIFGVGTGDFPKEYKKLNEINSPKMVQQLLILIICILWLLIAAWY